jgi:hypothetical protein
MLNSNFVITLITILATLMCLFQSEIKEGFNLGIDPVVYGSPPDNGLVKGAGFGYWGGNGQQFMPVEQSPIFNKWGCRVPQTTVSLGYGSETPLQPRNLPAGSKSSRNIVRPTSSNVKLDSVLSSAKKQRDLLSFRENYEDTFDNVQVEAARNMQPMVGGPPRFMVTGPKLDLYKPIDMARYAVDTQNPIVNYGCGDVYAADGQLQKRAGPVRENYEDASVGLPKDMTGSGMVSMYGKKDNQFYQPVIKDNLMYSNQKSRLRGLGDPIRGDLRIAPDNYKTYGKDGCGDSDSWTDRHNKWFQVSVKPNRDLNPGYIAQHNIRGKEVDEILAAVGLEPAEPLTNARATKGRDEEISISFGGTDISAESFGL